MKVHTIQKVGGPTITLEHKKPHPSELHEHEPADPKLALTTIERNDFKVVSGPRRKPKHFEFLGEDAANDLLELHVDLGGTLRKDASRDERRPEVDRGNSEPLVTLRN